ncbi:nif-specific transcriptional activator NifA [Thiothrix subterranea]|uniref:nif-specific transcriptional activator NifA n=1 Tax=Thiothrix subterranea TaxID=2735563 RepID=UPI00192B62EF|nr:nif-specific transcriptional activator NifA [Thiothrix subterranea]QQZ29624.1 nif-specific transcriptional activator NifA [Thiothrix subterranea]
MSHDNAQLQQTLNLLEDELACIYAVSKVLSRSLNLKETLREVLRVLHEEGQLEHGMVSLLDGDSGDLLLLELHRADKLTVENVRYRAGEGIMGLAIEMDKPLIIRKLADEPRFLDKLGVYNPVLPLIAVPIRARGDEIVGVLAAQPPAELHLLGERRRFLEMIGNLIGQNVVLANEVASDKQELQKERDSLRRKVKGESGFANLIGRTRVMQVVFDQARQVAKWNTTVLIRGESGTGKELIANAIHYHSPRANNAFIKLNCAALPDNLLESELFGHEKGAFTGAVSQRKGRFEQADGGTLFLDEIGEITPAFQAKLLRVLQEGEFERVGGSKTLNVDVRVIAATNRNLEQEVRAGEFREDLYYRLNVMPIIMPPLRERLEDIPDLARFLVNKISNKQARPLDIGDSAIRALMHHGWPGNVRELENCMERAAILSTDGHIDQQVIRLTGLENQFPADDSGGGRDAKFCVSTGSAGNGKPKADLNDPDLDERERVIAALEEAGWVQAKAARLLNMTPRQIAYRIQILNIQVRQI